MKVILNKSSEYFQHIKDINKSLKLNYCIEKNAGDSFNVSFLQDWLNLKVGKYTYGSSHHYLLCGSIASRANRFSTIIGAGLMSTEKVIKDYYRVVGCRGYLTRETLEGIKSTKFLGDPGALAREVISPIRVSEYKIGFVPHFVDYLSAKEIIGNEVKEVLLIDIKRDYKEVCRDILRCDIIISSSLHGLIFADSMGVPSVWINISDKVIGGEFKFNDYYSATSKLKKPFFVENMKDIELVSKSASISESINYEEMKKALYTEFNEFI